MVCAKMIGIFAFFAVVCQTYAEADASCEKKVWAHYVAWMHPAETSAKAADYYDPPAFDVREDPRRDEIALAREMGIDGWFVDAVFKKGEKTHYGDLAPFHRAAAGTDFMIGYCLDVKTDVDWQVAELVRMLAEHGGSPNYPKWHGRYVVFTYTWWKWTVEEWREMRRRCAEAGYPLYLVANLTFSYKPFEPAQVAAYAEVFEAAYNFGLAGLNGVRVDELNRTEAEICAEAGRRFIPGLHPGYLGGWFGRNPYYLPLRGLDTLHESFLAARETGGDWFHFTSWNDHDETTLAPRVLTPGMRQLVRAYADTLKGNEPYLPKSEVIFAYPREIIPGTMLRIEAMRLPGRMHEGVRTVRGTLRNLAGEAVFDLPPLALSNDYDRAEWLVPTTGLASSPVLTPTFSGGGREAVFSSIFFAESWLRNQQTIRETVANRAAVSNAFAVAWKDGVLSASLDFASEIPLKRAVLYADDRPVGVFTATRNPPATISLRAHGARTATRFGVKTVNGKRRAVVNRKGAKLLVAKYAGGRNLSFVLLTPEGDVPFTPQELLAASEIEKGGCRVAAVPDVGVYNTEPLALKGGTLALRTFALRPSAETSFFVRFELMDGRLCESKVAYPFAEAADFMPLRANVLETPVTLETTSGASGVPGASAFLTPPEKWAVRREAVVEADVSPLCERRFTRMGELVFDGTGTNAVRLLPHRAWPMGRCRITFEIKPTSVRSERPRGLIVKIGWQGGFAFELRPDGRVAAVWSANKDDGCVEVVSSEPVRADEWNRVEFVNDLRQAVLSLNGVASPSVAVPARRVYGNCEVVLGGGREGFDFYVGALRGLTVE